MRINNKIILSTYIALMLMSCENEKVSIDFLNPNLNITPQQILKLGFKRELVDIPMFSFNNSDTIITFTLTHDSLNLISQQWEVKFDDLDSISFTNFLSDYKSVITSNINFSTLGASNFCIYNYKRNLLFISSIIKESASNYLLRVSYYYPYN